MKKISFLFKNNYLKQISILTFLLLLFTFISAHSYVIAVSNDLSDSVFRLHVIANSDSDEDQSLKLKVRDSLINYMNSISSDCSTKEEAIALAMEHQEDFKNISEKTILENGYDYTVKINIDNFYFPTKNYGDISLPAGNYDALRVEIGKAEGQNWWCVMFPSLCFINLNNGIVDSDAKENLKNNLEEESYDVISDKRNTEIQFKFKLIEFFANNSLFTAKH